MHGPRTCLNADMALLISVKLSASAISQSVVRHILGLLGSFRRGFPDALLYLAPQRMSNVIRSEALTYAQTS